MDEFTAVLRARQLAAAVRPPSLPVDVQLYVDHLRGVVRLLDLPKDQPGYSTPIADLSMHLRECNRSVRKTSLHYLPRDRAFCAKTSHRSTPTPRSWITLNVR